MILLRRYLLLVTLMFWQGGFVFYASVVVPVGTATFDKHYRPPGTDSATGRRQQGRITRTVAHWINVAGAAALVVMGWDVFAGSDRGRRRSCRLIVWAAAAVLLGVLFWMYAQLDAQFNRDTLALADEAAFLSQHRIYLWVLAAQWGCCLIYLLLTLAAWRAGKTARSPLAD